MFKKLKDKLAEEVKSSPQRIQQFAQAAQAAVTSASSSISDITNNDLFSIGDNDINRQNISSPQKQGTSSFQDVSLKNSGLPSEKDHESYAVGFTSPSDNQRQRRLSNSSFASDVSFKLPTYESTSMYHLQSDMDISASEAEERGLGSPGVSLERVTKEQLYAAYRRTQDRYTKYRTQYADLARHYKLLERDNSKARSVLVETQDKALRRISELREQCSLEQSAKAHLERALRIELDEKNIKIETLNTQIKLLQENTVTKPVDDGVAPLINIDNDSNDKSTTETSAEIINLNNKIEKMDQLINKYKESLKSMKEKNTQLTINLQQLTKETENLKEESSDLLKYKQLLETANEDMQKLKDQNEDMQNKLNTYDFAKTKEMSTLEVDLDKAKEEIVHLKKQIDVFSKREEENAISLAENKLSIHKELESKESEIRSLKNTLAEKDANLQSLSATIDDYKFKITNFEKEIMELKSDISVLQMSNNQATEKESELEKLLTKCQTLEQVKSKAEEECRSLHLQVKQECAEKLAMIDRNSYLEERNKQLSEDNISKKTCIAQLEKEIEIQRNNFSNDWKEKCLSLESEMHEERVELAKLQTEIEKLLKNDDYLQHENSKLHAVVNELQSTNSNLKINLRTIHDTARTLMSHFMAIKNAHAALRNEVYQVETNYKLFFANIDKEIKELLNSLHHKNEFEETRTIIKDLETNKSILETHYNELKEKNELLLGENESLKNNIRDLTTKHEHSDSEMYSKLSAELHEIKSMYDAKIKELTDLKDENSKMTYSIEHKEQEYQTELKALTDNHEKLLLEYERLKSEIDGYVSDIKNLNLANEAINKKLEEATSEYESKCSLLKTASVENSNLKEALLTASKKYEDLELKNNDLIEDNKNLKTKFQNIVSSVELLECELAEIRQSHSDIDKEKDRLNSVLELLEQSRSNVEMKNEESQTTNNPDENVKEILNGITEENHVLKAKCEQIKQEKEILYEKVISLENKCSEYDTKLLKYEKIVNKNNDFVEKSKEMVEERTALLQNIDQLNQTVTDLNQKLQEKEDHLHNYESFKGEYEVMREDNRRLLSDIEGLQTYLTKISKENSILNDKLRESIASSETNDHKTGHDVEEIEILRTQIQNEKARVEELLRQNSLLNEENYELKDQIQSHSYSKVSTDKDIERKQDPTLGNSQYETLKSRNSLQDRKIKDLEVVNETNNNNLIQLQESNNKLRLTNEKLERRLDEALVSLRHLHSLQENTELEYLRNILYEYLTGPGTHSLTLAKVLAAVVKFDEKQTNSVLQKEKERQGLLRQLGLT